jgi:hypothetical protein
VRPSTVHVAGGLLLKTGLCEFHRVCGCEQPELLQVSLNDVQPVFEAEPELVKECPVAGKDVPAFVSTPQPERLQVILPERPFTVHVAAEFPLKEELCEFHLVCV